MTNFEATLSMGASDVLYVLIDEREDFDKIKLPVTDHRQQESRKPVLSKSILEGPQWVVFQYWLKEEDA